LKPKLFGSSGIRGLANHEVTVALSQRVGQALATTHEGGSIFVGRDVRMTGPMLEEALLSGLGSCGADVTTVGVVPTPVLAWVTRASESEAGVAISASHNPPEYNGLKLFNGSGMSLTLAEQLRIESILEDNSYKFATWDEVGTVDEADAVEPYVEAISDVLNLDTELRVACDLFSGATCTVAPLAFSELGVEAEHINSVPDGTFPTGNPEPDIVSLTRLGRFMKERGIDIGFGFDGDGDRMMPLNQNGEVVNPDRLLAAYAGYIVERSGGGIVVTHVGASMSVNETVEQAGGRVVRTPVGDAFITEAIAKNDAVFGGEPVGAWVMPEVHLCPDGLLGALKLLEALDYTCSTLDEFIRTAPVFPLDRWKMDCPNRLKNSVMEKIEKNYLSVFTEVEEVNKVDGLRLELSQGWVLIRPSGTEPIIRVTAEGRTKSDVDFLMEKGRMLVKDALVKA
jgi:phosphoglucosamine mutase